MNRNLIEYLVIVLALAATFWGGYIIGKTSGYNRAMTENQAQIEKEAMIQDLTEYPLESKQK